MDTIEIPGGTAQIRGLDELTVGQERMIQRGHIATLRILMASSDLTERLEQQAERLKAEQGDEAVQTQDELVASMDGPTRLAMLRSSLGASDEDLMVMERYQSAVVLAFLDSWTLDRPLPTMETIDGLPGKLFRVLTEATVDRSTELVNGGAAVDFTPTPPTSEFADTPFVGSAT